MRHFAALLIAFIVGLVTLQTMSAEEFDESETVVSKSREQLATELRFT
jgi:hypothetical protein